LSESRHTFALWRFGDALLSPARITGSAAARGA